MHQWKTIRVFNQTKTENVRRLATWHFVEQTLWGFENIQKYLINYNIKDDKHKFEQKHKQNIYGLLCNWVVVAHE